MSRSWGSRPLGWPLAVLVLGAGVVALVGVEVSRSIRTQEAVAERARDGYGKFALWSYREHLMVSLRATARAVLGPVNHGDQLHLSPGIPRAASLGHYLPYAPDCLCHRPEAGPLPRAFYGFTIGADTVERGPNFAPDPTTGWLADPVEMPLPRDERLLLPAEEGRWLSGVLTDQVRRTGSQWGYQWLVAEWDGEPRYFVATTMPTGWGDTVVYAAEYSHEAMDTLFNAVLDDPGLLPFSDQRELEGLPGAGSRALLSLQVSTPSGLPIVSWHPPRRWRSPPTPMPVSFGGFQVQLEIVPAMIERLVIGGLPRTRTPVLFGLLCVAIGLTAVAALLLRRELRFAQARADFVASVSHELRTPLAQVRLALDAMARRPDDDAALRERGMQLIDREVLRLQHLVDDVLQFRRGVAREPARVREPVDLAHAVAGLVDEFRPLAAGKGTTIRLEADPGTVVPLESGALRHIVLNLLENATKYGPAGQEVVVRVGRDEGDAVIEVEDHGPGVAESERDRIWEPYERGSAAMLRGAGGSGIGLAVVRDVVARHGGDVAVGSAPDGGARFRVTLPAGAPD